MAELKMRIDCDRVGYRFGYQYVISHLDLEHVMPPRSVVTPMDYADYQDRAERRKRLVDVISANIAHALTDALVKQTSDGN